MIFQQTLFYEFFIKMEKLKLKIFKKVIQLKINNLANIFFKETALIKSLDFNILIRCWLFSKLSFENLICIFKKTLREAFKEFILKTSEKFNVMNIHKFYI